MDECINKWMRGGESAANHTFVHFVIFLQIVETICQWLAYNFMYSEVSGKECLAGKLKGDTLGNHSLIC